MLTQEELNKLQEQLTEANENSKTLLSIKNDMLTFIKNNVKAYLSKISLIDNLSIYFDYDYDYILAKSSNEQKARKANIRISSINDVHPCFGFFEVVIKDDKIEYSHASGSFTSADTATVLSINLITMMIAHENDLRNVCFEMFDRYNQVCENYWNAVSTERTIKRQIEKHEEEVQRNEALTKLVEGQLYEDHAGKDWFLKVTKITNKLVYCETLKYFENGDWYSSKPGIYHISTRVIKKDDFIHYLESGYYVVSDRQDEIVK